MKQSFVIRCLLFVLIKIVPKVATMNNEVNQREAPPVPLQGTFKAAVYEHAVILPTYRQTAVPRNAALGNMMKNLLIYQQQAERAAAEVRNLLSLFFCCQKKVL